MNISKDTVRFGVGSYQARHYQSRRNRPPHMHLESLQNALRALETGDSTMIANPRYREAPSLKSRMDILRRKIEAAQKALIGQLKRQGNSPEKIQRILANPRAHKPSK